MSLMSRLQAQQQVDKSMDAVQVNREITEQISGTGLFYSSGSDQGTRGELQVGGRDEEQTQQLEQQVQQIAETFFDRQTHYYTKTDRGRSCDRSWMRSSAMAYYALLRDETISEVMVNGPQQVYVERRGKLELTR